MHSSIELNKGLDRLKSILATFPAESTHWNEAQNRFQFIDRLLFECLGWQKPDAEVESPDGAGGRSDYHLGRHPIKAVLEAKRESTHFELPPKGTSGLVRKIAPIATCSKSFKDAVAQVIGYCAMHGASIAIVCNGPQLAIFQAMVPGSSAFDGDCYFFNGFNSYVEDFPELWKLLSPEGITENYAHRALSSRRNPRLPPKASVSIAEPLKYRYRNSFQEELRRLSSFLLEEIEDNPDLRHDFYRECYIPIEANNRHLLLSKNIISARYRRVSDDGINPAPLDKATKIDRGTIVFHESVVTTASGSRPIVVVGDVGVGKTSFFENLFESLSGTEKDNTYFLHLNLGAEATLTSNIKDYVLLHVPATLKHKYGLDIDSAEFANSIYYRELSDFIGSCPTLTQESKVASKKSTARHMSEPESTF